MSAIAVREQLIFCVIQGRLGSFESDFEVTMVPLEVTHTAIATREEVDRVTSLGTPFAQSMADILQFFATTYRDVFGFMEGPPIHDACAIAYCIDKSLFQARKMRVDVVSDDSICAGQTVCDVWGDSDRPANVNVCEKMDVAGFFSLSTRLVSKQVKCRPWSRASSLARISRIKWKGFRIKRRERERR